MTLDCDQYRINVVSIKALMDPKSDKERTEFISSLAIITGVPIIIVCHYVGELYGFTDALEARIGRLKHFYKVTEVFNSNRSISNA